jgi:hypothetical protein
MKVLLLLVLTAVISVAAFGVVAAREVTPAEVAPRPIESLEAQAETPALSGAAVETTWIFDADFEDITGDNYGIDDLGQPGDSLTGWYTVDLSGTPGKTNHWHLDTLNSYKDGTPPDSSMWCGSCDHDCPENWELECGYGLGWIDYLSHYFDLTPYDSARIVFRHIFAMEKDYDYGFVEVTTDSGESWNILASYTNPGFEFTPGVPQFDWDGANNHPSVDLSEYAGRRVTMRWRFESDGAVSSKDCCCGDCDAVDEGAWYIDEVELYGNGERVFYETFDNGDSGWVHVDIEPEGQTGVVWRRAYDPPTHRGFDCLNPGGWMLVPTDPATNKMVDYEVARLVTPEIDISGLTSLIMLEDRWFDFPDVSNHFPMWYGATSDEEGCARRFWPAYSGIYYGYKGWQIGSAHNCDRYSGNNYFRFAWDVGWLIRGLPPTGLQMGGLYLSRVRMGIVTMTEYPTEITVNQYYLLEDTFDPSDAAADSARVQITDYDGIASARIVFSTDGGETWNSNAMTPTGPSQYYIGKTGVTAKGTEILYYFEATDSLGSTTTRPANAPVGRYEYSILPFSHDTGRVLLVNGDGGLVTNQWEVKAEARDYYKESLDTWGFVEQDDYDIYDIAIPGGQSQNAGPDSLELYDTVIWFTGDLDRYTLVSESQSKLQSFLDLGRNLYLSGNDIAEYLVEDGEGPAFFTDYLHATFTPGEGSLIDPVNDDVADTVVQVTCPIDSLDFLPFDAYLDGGCPDLQHFDKVGNDSLSLRAFEYVSTKPGNPVYPAGIVYSGDYKLVYTGFGLERIMPYGTDHPRAWLMRRVLEFFGHDIPDTTGPVGVSDPVQATKGGLLGSYPNPFNPTVTIEYSISEPGQVKLQVFNISGQIVRTLVDAHIEPGKHEVVWDGTDSNGREVSSGIYFYRLAAPELKHTKRMVIVR